MEVGIRPGGHGDKEACAAICYEAFRGIAEAHGFAPDIPSAEIAVTKFARWLSRPGFFVLVAEAGGRVVGSAVLDERSPVVGLGPITVDPVVQDQSIGRRLVEAAIERVTEHEKAGLRLLQNGYHVRSLSLYTKLGFDVREPLVNIQGSPLMQKTWDRVVRVATVGDLDDCDALCSSVHGYSRSAEVSEAIEEGTARVVEHEGRITGYVTTLGFFGHAVGESDADLKALISAAEGFAGPGFLLPTRSGELFRWCLDNGLRAVQLMTLMSLGLYNEPAGVFMPSITY